MDTDTKAPAEAEPVPAPPPAPTEYDLTEPELKALTLAGNERAFLQAQLADQRTQLAAQLAEIDRTLARAQGSVEGCFQAILNLRGFEGPWRFDQARHKIVRVPVPDAMPPAAMPTPAETTASLPTPAETTSAPGGA